MIRVLLVLMFSQVFWSTLLKSQSCYVDYTDPSELEFLAAGGSELVYFYTYPTNCVPDITCPSWVSWTMVGWGEVMFYCSQNNTEQERVGIIYVGEEGLWIGVWQQAGLVAGVISGDQAICYNADPSNITSSSAAGGGTQPYTYVWERSTDGGYYWSTLGVSTQTYDPSSLTETTKYRRKVTDASNATAYSNIVTKTVWNPLSGGAISEDQIIAYNEEGSLITSDTAASGGSGSLTYQWKKSMFDGGAWSEWATIRGNVRNVHPTCPDGYNQIQERRNR